MRAAFLSLALLFAVGACAKAPRPAELSELDKAMKDEESLTAMAEAAPDDVAQARNEYAKATESYEDGDIEDAVSYAKLADLSLKIANERLRLNRAETLIATAKRTKTDAAKRLADSIDMKGKVEKRVARMEKILALQASLESEKAASRAAKRDMEAQLRKAKKEQEAALEMERERQELVELVATVRAKHETAEVMNAEKYAPKALSGSLDTLALAQRAIVADQFEDARKLIASADESATKALTVARREYKERVGKLEERDKILEDAADIVETSATQERGVVVTLYGMFAPGESEVLEEMKPVLDALATLAKKYPEYPILVEGYTDSQGREKTNLDLSEARARSVLDQLFAKGIETKRARSAGYGEARPVADNSTPAGRAKNRRVEFVLLFP